MSTLVVKKSGGTYSSVQTAINNASDGDTVEVRNGTYDEEATIDVKNLTLTGESKTGVSIKKGFQVQADGVTVSDLTSGDAKIRDFKGIELQDPSGNGVVENITIENTQLATPIRPSNNLDTIEFVGNELIQDGASGLVFGGQNADNKNVLIKDNVIRPKQGKTVWDGIFVKANSGSNVDVTIKDNVIKDYQNSAGLGIGIYLELDQGASKAEVTVKNNTVKTNDYGLTVASKRSVAVSSPTADGITISNNNLYDNKTSAIKNGASGELDATNNWWGDSSGPSGEGPGSGDSVSTGVKFDPFVTRLQIRSSSGGVSDALFDKKRLDDNNKFVADTTGNGKETAEDDKRLAELSKEGRLDDLSPSEQKKLDYDGDGEVTFDDIVTKVFERKGLLQ